jgi:hypothetical protein
VFVADAARHGALAVRVGLVHDVAVVVTHRERDPDVAGGVMTPEAEHVVARSVLPVQWTSKLTWPGFEAADGDTALRMSWKSGTAS